MIDKGHLSAMLSGDFLYINGMMLKKSGFIKSENFGF